MSKSNLNVVLSFSFRTRCIFLGPSSSQLNLTPAATQRKAVMKSSCRAVLISSKTSTTSAALHRNGLILRFLVRNKCSVFFNVFSCPALQTFSFPFEFYQCVFLSGDTLHYRFMSDMSNTEWGYKFTVTGGHRGRFQTGNSPDQRKVPRQMVLLDQKLFLLMIMPSFLPRL